MESTNPTQSAIVAGWIIIGKNSDKDDLGTFQRGDVQTPKVAFFKGLRLRWLHRRLIRRLRRGDVALEAIQIRKTKAGVYRLIAEITGATGTEVAFIRTEFGLVKRLGTRAKVSMRGALRVIAHSHPTGRLGLSIAAIQT
jgi:hypothetical protein